MLRTRTMAFVAFPPFTRHRSLPSFEVDTKTVRQVDPAFTESSILTFPLTPEEDHATRTRRRRLHVSPAQLACAIQSATIQGRGFTARGPGGKDRAS